jgi:hypothetical protein
MFLWLSTFDVLSFQANESNRKLLDLSSLQVFDLLSNDVEDLRVVTHGHSDSYPNLFLRRLLPRLFEDLLVMALNSQWRVHRSLMNHQNPKLNALISSRGQVLL